MLEWQNVIVAFKCKHFQLNHNTTYFLRGLRKDDIRLIQSFILPVSLFMFNVSNDYKWQRRSAIFAALRTTADITDSVW